MSYTTNKKGQFSRLPYMVDQCLSCINTFKELLNSEKKELTLIHIVLRQKVNFKLVLTTFYRIDIKNYHHSKI